MDKDYKQEFYKARLDDYNSYRLEKRNNKDIRDDSLQERKFYKNVSKVKSGVGYISLLTLAIGFIFVLFGNPFDSERFFRTLISADYAPFSLDTFITHAHGILPDGVGIFNGIENLFIAIGCLGYSIGFLINLVFALLFA